MEWNGTTPIFLANVEKTRRGRDSGNITIIWTMGKREDGRICVVCDVVLVLCCAAFDTG